MAASAGAETLTAERHHNPTATWVIADSCFLMGSISRGGTHKKRGTHKKETCI